MIYQGQRLTPLEMLAKLVSFDTESSKIQPPADRFRRRLSQELAGPLHPGAERDRRQGGHLRHNRPGGPRRDRAVRHTDVVPVTGQAWTSDPFTLRVANGRAYGRGAVDMKAFDALALALVPEFQAANLTTRSISCCPMTRKPPASASPIRSAVLGRPAHAEGGHRGRADGARRSWMPTRVW